MMKKILSHDIIRLTEYLDTVVYFFLLAFPNLKAAPAKSMLHDKHIRKQIIKYRKMLNETSVGALTHYYCIVFDVLISATNWHADL